MKDHFSDDDIKYCLTESKFTEKLSKLKQHLAECKECSEKLTSKKEQLTNLQIHLKRELQMAEEIIHPTTEELKSYVKAKLDALDSEIIKGHTSNCIDCKKKINAIKITFEEGSSRNKILYYLFYIPMYSSMWLANFKEVLPELNHRFKTNPITMAGIFIIFLSTTTYALYQRNLSQEAKVLLIESKLSEQTSKLFEQSYSIAKLLQQIGGTNDSKENLTLIDEHKCLPDNNKKPSTKNAQVLHQQTKRHESTQSNRTDILATMSKTLIMDLSNNLDTRVQKTSYSDKPAIAMVTVSSQSTNMAVDAKDFYSPKAKKQSITSNDTYNTYRIYLENYPNSKLTLVTLKSSKESSTISPENVPPHILEKTLKGVCSITTYAKDKSPLNIATGFFISENGELITNRHVFRKATTATIKTIDKKEYIVDGIIGEDKNKDLLKVLVKSAQSSFSPLSLNNSTPKQGESLITIGNPMNLEGTVTDGILSAIRNDQDLGDILQISAPLWEGSSGSPVLNTQGQVIGVVCRKMKNTENLNFAIPSQAIRSLKSCKLQTISEWNIQNSEDETLHLHVNAKNLISKGKYEEALENLNEIILLEPEGNSRSIQNINFAQIWFEIGTCKGQMNNDKGALEAFKKAIQLKSKSSNLELNLDEAYLSLAAAYSRLGETERALKAYENVTKYDSRGYYNLGVLYSQKAKSNPEEAKFYYEKSIENYLKASIPNSKYTAQAYFGLGIAYKESQKYTEAVEAYKKAIEINPTFLEPYNNLAVIYNSYLNQFEDARDSCLKVLRIKPNDMYAHFNLGVAYMNLDLKHEALQEYEILKNLDEKAANMLFDFIYKK